MDFSLTEEEQMLVQLAGQFGEAELRPQMRAHEAAGALPTSLCDSFEQTGIPLLGAAEVDPDLPVSWPARCRAIQKLAQADGAATLQLWRSAWLPPAATKLGSSGTAHALVLVRDRQALSWPIPCLPVGGGSRLLVLDDAGSWGIASVSTTEVSALALAAAGPAQCTLIDWVEQGQASPSAAAAARGSARLWGATILTGIAQASLSYTSAYVQERFSFGKALSNHQAVAFIVAEMAMRVEGMDATCIHAAWLAESGDLGPCNDAWLECIEAALWVTDQGVQLLGGHGYTRDHPVEKWMREARALSLLWGGVDLAMDEAARGEG